MAAYLDISAANGVPEVEGRANQCAVRNKLQFHFFGF